MVEDMIMSIVCLLVEIALAVFIGWGILNEQKLVRIERAAVKAVLWELYERFAERYVKRIEKGGEVK